MSYRRHGPAARQPDSRRSQNPPKTPCPVEAAPIWDLLKESAPSEPSATATTVAAREFVFAATFLAVVRLGNGGKFFRHPEGCALPAGTVPPHTYDPQP